MIINGEMKCEKAIITYWRILTQYLPMTQKTKINPQPEQPVAWSDSTQVPYFTANLQVAVLTLLCLTPLHSYQSLFKHNILLSKYCIYLNMRQPCIYDSHSSQSSIFRKISIHSMFKFVCNYNANPHFSEYELG